MPNEPHALVEHVFGSVLDEVTRQNELWTRQGAIPADRWLEIATDEWNDLRWAVRSRAEIANHTIAKERDQLIAVLLRWKVAERDAAV